MVMAAIPAPLVAVGSLLARQERMTLTLLQMVRMGSHPA